MKVDTSDIPEVGEEWFAKARRLTPRERAHHRAQTPYLQDVLRLTRGMDGAQLRALDRRWSAAKPLLPHPRHRIALRSLIEVTE